MILFKFLLQTSLLGHLKNKETDVYGSQEVLVIDPDGFVKIIRYLSGQTFTANDSRLRLSETVNEIHYELENDQNVPDGLPKDGVYVRTSGGNEYWARHCILTFSVRLLHKLLFTVVTYIVILKHFLY